jgi:hypothetical protein
VPVSGRCDVILNQPSPDHLLRNEQPLLHAPLDLQAASCPPASAPETGADRAKCIGTEGRNAELARFFGLAAASNEHDSPLDLCTQGVLTVPD